MVLYQMPRRLKKKGRTRKSNFLRKRKKRCRRKRKVKKSGGSKE